MTPNDRTLTAARSPAHWKRYNRSCAFGGRSPSSPDMRISAINKMPTKPPPTIPATTHQNETIWSPPFHWSRNSPGNAGSAPGPLPESGAFGCPPGAQQSLHSLRVVSKRSGSAGCWNCVHQDVKKRPGTDRVDDPCARLYPSQFPETDPPRPSPASCRSVSYKYRHLAYRFKAL